MRKRKLYSLFALVAALSLVAAACGGDDEEPGGGETGTTGPTATGGAVDCEADEFGCVEVAAGAPIRLGSLLAISGDRRAVLELAEAFRAAVPS